MFRIRRFETTCNELYLGAKIPGMSPHLYIGEEASAASVCFFLNTDDYIVSNHRGHGHCLGKGAAMDRMLAEIMGKSTGYCRGRGGSMHIADVTLGNLGANGIVGAGIPIAVGAGLSIVYRGTHQISVVFFGDAATNQGTFHEGVNMAGAMKLPVLLVCENNQYGLSTLIQRTSSTAVLSDKAHGYGIEHVTVDGMDAEVAFQAARTAVEYVRTRAQTVLPGIRHLPVPGSRGQRQPKLPHQGGRGAVEEAIPRGELPAADALRLRDRGGEDQDPGGRGRGGAGQGAHVCPGEPRAVAGRRPGGRLLPDAGR